jgi:hypothetical protein
VVQESSPDKETSKDDQQQEELNFKDYFKALDEKKKKIFMNYKRWKFSLYN